MPSCQTVRPQEPAPTTPFSLPLLAATLLGLRATGQGQAVHAGIPARRRGARRMLCAGLPWPSRTAGVRLQLACVDGEGRFTKSHPAARELHRCVLMRRRDGADMQAARTTCMRLCLLRRAACVRTTRRTSGCWCRRLSEGPAALASLALPSHRTFSGPSSFQQGDLQRHLAAEQQR